MKKTIYNAISQQLLQSTTGINHVGLWNSNTDQLTAQKAFTTPAVFVEFGPIEWMQSRQGVRTADLRVQLHITSGQDNDQQFGLVEQVAIAIQTLSGDGFSGLVWIESATDHNHKGIVFDRECFTTKITAISAMKKIIGVEGVKLVEKS